MIRAGEMDGVVFDMDGVIFDSETLGIKAWKVIVDRYGFEDIETVAMKCIGRSTKDTMAIIKESYGEDIDIDKLYAECRAVMKDIIRENHGIPKKAGAVELLSWLREKGIKVALASSTSYRTVVEELTEAGLRDYFEVIVGGDMIENSKPEPDIYLMACEKLGVRPENTIAVEDSRNGIISAYRAGMKAVLVPDLIEPDEEMLKMAYTKLSSLTELRERLSETGI